MQPSQEVLTAPVAPLPGRWAMAVRVFLAYNIVVGCAFGGFSVALLAIREKYNVDVATASMCMSAIMLSSGLASPFSATLIGRFGIRAVMIVGALLTVLGYIVLAFAPSIHVVLAAYAVFIGLGIATCGAFPANVIANSWFQPSPGRAVGFVNMAVGVAVVPLAMESVIAVFGLRAFYLTFAALSALVIPIVWGLTDAPAPLRAGEAADAAPSADTGIPAARLLRSASYWTLIICGGVLISVTMAGLAHIVAFATERGQRAQEAAMFASLLGGAGIAGAMLAGILCDRIGGALALMLAGLGMAVGWSTMFLTTATAPMIAAVLLIGVSGAGIYPAVSVLAGKIYGRATLPRALGLYSLFILPTTILLPPVAGLLRDATGDYQLMALVFVGIGVVAAAIFYIMSRMMNKRRGAEGMLLSEA